MKALIDADLVAYRCAASCEKQGVLTEDFGVATQRANNLLVAILEATKADDRKLYLSGGENFRKKISPSYKANRDEQKRPDYLEPLREWLVTEWGATVSDGNEADDELGIAQTGSRQYLREVDGVGNQIVGYTTVICSLDKDLRQVPGHHYSWEITGTSVLGKQWKKEAEHLFVTEQEGLFNFYWQLVMGDAADNVPGFDGKMRAKVPKFLESHYNNMIAMVSEQELFNYVLELYQLSTGQLLNNGACLWVQRYEGDNWLQKGRQLLEVSTMEGFGPSLDSIRSLLQPFEQEPDVGNLSTTP